MSNYIRACFIIDHKIPSSRFYQLMLNLDAFACNYNVSRKGKVSGYLSQTDQTLQVVEEMLDEQTDLKKLESISQWLAGPDYVSVGLGWSVLGQVYNAGITQLQQRLSETEQRCVSFDVEETVFFPGRALAFVPTPGDFFAAYKELVSEVIKQFEPVAGVLDYEADFPFEGTTKYGTCSGWGNYLPMDLLNHWSVEDRNLLRQIADEYIQLGNLGVLIFIHPLTPNQSQTERHIQFESLLKRHNILSQCF